MEEMGPASLVPCFVGGFTGKEWYREESNCHVLNQSGITSFHKLRNRRQAEPSPRSDRGKAAEMIEDEQAHEKAALPATLLGKILG
jgi:hypothetical protein